MKKMIVTMILCSALAPTVAAHELETGAHAPTRRTLLHTVDLLRTKSMPTNKVFSPAKPEEPTTVEEKGEALEVIYEDSDFYTFGAQIIIENKEKKFRVQYVTKNGTTPPILQPGTYSAYTEASRKGFPQEVKYQIVDIVSGDIIEEFPRTHVPVNNVVLEKGQKLRIVILPATRPYNSVFFRLGKLRTPVALIFNRPYPAFDFEPGEFAGNSQFSSTQIAIAFWGMKRVAENPSLAEHIRKEGVPGLRTGDTGRVRDPILVLGTREIARDLAETFVKERTKNTEDVRGKFHIAFLVQRTNAGKIPRDLLSMDVEELTKEFERQILWIEMHNVHRASEGGGYAGKTFLEVVDEAKEKVQAWPRISYLSTELERTEVGTMERIAAEAGMDTVVTFNSGESGIARRLLKEEIQRLVRAIRRERMNYETYEEEWLQDVVSTMGTSVSERLSTLAFTEEMMLSRLLVLDPSDATVE